MQELLPIVLACTIWGPVWHHSSVMVHCDNSAAITVVNSGYSRVPQIMHLLRCLFFIRAHFQMSLHAVHTPGHLNSVADAISRNNLTYLLIQVPTAAHAQDRIPPTLLELLVTQQPDLDITDLDKAVQQLFSSGLAPSTRRSYQSGSNQYLQFCNLYNIVPPFPVDEKHLTRFVAFLFIKGLSGGTVKHYLAALHYTQISLGLGDPQI